MSALVFDIETRPLPEETLREICPPFKEESVKCGNLGAIAAKKKIDKARESHLERFIDRAALDASTGQVCAIGYLNGECTLDLDPDGDDEEGLIIRFWKTYEQVSSQNGHIVGFNSNRFDVPFIVRRSYILGIPFPSNAIEGRYLNKTFVDLADRWFCGGRGSNDYISLDFLCRALGVDAGKTGSGKDFHRLLKEDKPAAEAYLKNDLDCTEACGRKLRVVT